MYYTHTEYITGVALRENNNSGGEEEKKVSGPPRRINDIYT